jgi:hypothetical protein
MEQLDEIDKFLMEEDDDVMPDFNNLKVSADVIE